jgi:hypothetical protein
VESLILRRRAQMSRLSLASRPPLPHAGGNARVSRSHPGIALITERCGGQLMHQRIWLDIPPRPGAPMASHATMDLAGYGAGWVIRWHLMREWTCPVMALGLGDPMASHAWMDSARHCAIGVRPAGISCVSRFIRLFASAAGTIASRKPPIGPELGTPLLRLCGGGARIPRITWTRCTVDASDRRFTGG